MFHVLVRIDPVKAVLSSTYDVFLHGFRFTLCLYGEKREKKINLLPFLATVTSFSVYYFILTA